MDPEEATDIFIKVSDVYSVLSSKEKRKIYDQYEKNGLDAFEKWQDPASAGFEGFGDGQGWQGGQQQQQPAQTDIFAKGQSYVVQLGKLKSLDKKSKHMWMIMFYANDNNESRQVSEKYENLAIQSNLPYKVGAVDCRMSTREDFLCVEKGIDSSDGELVPFMDYDYSSSSFSKAFHTFCMDNMLTQYVQNINNVPQI